MDPVDPPQRTPEPQLPVGQPRLGQSLPPGPGPVPGGIPPPGRGPAAGCGGLPGGQLPPAQAQQSSPPQPRQGSPLSQMAPRPRQGSPQGSPPTQMQPLPRQGSPQGSGPGGAPPGGQGGPGMGPGDMFDNQRHGGPGPVGMPLRQGSPVPRGRPMPMGRDHMDDDPFGRMAEDSSFHTRGPPVQRPMNIEARPQQRFGDAFFSGGFGGPRYNREEMLRARDAMLRWQRGNPPAEKGIRMLHFPGMEASGGKDRRQHRREPRNVGPGPDDARDFDDRPRPPLPGESISGGGRAAGMQGAGAETKPNQANCPTQ